MNVGKHRPDKVTSTVYTSDLSVFQFYLLNYTQYQKPGCAQYSGHDLKFFIG